MKFGIANAISHHPAKAYPLADVYRDYIADAVLAEELGYSFSWYGEHRMTPCQWTPSPLTVCAWVAAKTRTMRVGPQVLCLPFHNPLRVAEDVAVIDIMSNGRFDFGIGVGSQFEEFRTFGINSDERVGRTWEMADLIERCFAEKETFSFKGKYYDFPEITFTTKPVQQKMRPMRGQSLNGCRNEGVIDPDFIGMGGKVFARFRHVPTHDQARSAR